MKNRTHLQIRIRPEHYEALEKIAKRTPDPQGLQDHATVSDVVRRALLNFLVENGELKENR